MTMAIVATQNVDMQEAGAFLEKFYSSVAAEILGGSGNLNGSVDLEAAARPLQSSDAEQKYLHLTTDVNNFIE